MGDLPTIKVKSGDDYAIINQRDYNPDVHQPYDDESRKAVKNTKNDPHADKIAEADALRRADAERGVIRSPAAAEIDRNPTGTFSEPTPSDVRFPDKDATEFENNHGAFIGKSAAGLREERGLPDAPGGIKPEGADEPVDTTSGLHVARGPGGRFFVKNGKERISEGFASEDEANAALAAEQAKAAPLAEQQSGATVS